MKIWHSYGSEHSMNLVLIGKFKDASTAVLVKDIIDRLVKQATEDMDKKVFEVGEPADHYSDSITELLRDAQVYDIPTESLEQFVYDVNVRSKGNDVILTTDESDVSAFIQVMLTHGGRIELFSAHDHTFIEADD